MHCFCRPAGLKCTDLCACSDCQNCVAANTEDNLSDAEDELEVESELECSDDDFDNVTQQKMINTCSGLMKTGLNNVLLPTLLIVVKVV